MPPNHPMAEVAVDLGENHLDGQGPPSASLRYQHVMADRRAALASALDDLALAATKPRGTERARKGTHGARRRR